MRHLPIIALLLLAAALRVASITMPRGDFFANDGWDYRDISYNLAEGKGYARSMYRSWYEPKPPGAPGLHPDLHRPPLLPLIGVPLYLLPGEWTDWAKGVSVLIGVAATAAIYAAARPIFGRSAALVATALFAIYPYAIHRASRWSTESLMAVCLLATVACLVRYRGAGHLGWVAGAGLAAGLTTLARPSGILFALAFLAWIAVEAWRRRRPRRLTALAVYAGMLALVLAPWTIRNARLTGIPTPATFFGPYNMWRGMNDPVYEMYRTFSRERHAELLTDMNRASGAHVDTLEARGIFGVREVNAYWREAALDYVREHPGRALYIGAARALHAVRPWLDPETRPRDFWIAVAGFVPTTLLAVCALARVPHAREILIVLPIAVGLAGSVPFTFDTRLRFPFYDPFVVILAGAGAHALWMRFHARRAGSRGEVA